MRSHIDNQTPRLVQLGRERDQARGLVVDVASHAADVEESDHDREAARDRDDPAALKPVHALPPGFASARAAVTRALRAPSPGSIARRSSRSRGSCSPEGSWLEDLAAWARTRGAPRARRPARAR